MSSEAEEGTVTAVSNSALASAKKYAFINSPSPSTTRTLWGPLAKGSDLKWSMTGAAWITEAQNFYIIGKDGSLVFMQIGYSNLGWPSTTCQVTARYYKPPTKGSDECVNLFETQTLSALRMKMSSDYTSVTVSRSSIHHFHVGNDELAIIKLAFGEGSAVGFELNLRPIVRPFEFKPDGTIWFASDNDVTSEFIRMKFLPAIHVTGHLKNNDGTNVQFEGHALLIHQFQGIKPHVAAKRWNLAYFVSEKQVTTLFQLQLTAADAYHGECVNYGAIVREGQMYAVSASNEIVEADHFICADSAFEVPRSIKYLWKGTDANNVSFAATCNTQLRQQCACISLLDNVPYVLRKVIEAFVAKPYVYQWLDKTEVTIKTQGKPDEVIAGWIFQEICMI